jgi:hypothetical protein
LSSAGTHLFGTRRVGEDTADRICKLTGILRVDELRGDTLVEELEEGGRAHTDHGE